MIKVKNIPPYLKIMLGMVIGGVVGGIATYFGWSEFVFNWVSPFGEIFIRLLKLIAIPLVLVSLIKGIGSLQDVSILATLGVKSISLYLLSTIISILLAVALVSAIRPGEVVSSELSQQISHSTELVESAKEGVEMEMKRSPLQPLVDIVPENAVGSLAQNSSMLQVIFIAILFGVATILVGGEVARPFIDLISSVDAIVIKCIDIAMGFAPVGVMALIATMVCESSGDGTLLGALGMYVVTVVLALLFMIAVIYPLVVSWFTKIKYREFVKALFPVQLMGFSTSSSAATLATTMKMSDEVLHLPKSVTSFTLPLGVTINMDGTSVYQTIAVIFIAQVMGIDLTWMQLLTIIITTTLSSIGAPGVPGGSIVISMMVLTAAGIPVEGLALILGVDRPLDMLRTSVNVTGDVAVSAIVAASVDKS